MNRFEEICNLLPKPYYKDEWVAIYLADCRELLPLIPDKSIDLVLTDPPYGIGKAEWDNYYDIQILNSINTLKLGLLPGVWNIIKTPSVIGKLKYKWMLIAHLINGMTRGGMGFGNYIPCLVYLADNVSVFDKTTDCLSIVVGCEDKPNHPSPKPERAMLWFTQRLSNKYELILDPFLGSGTTAYCAKKLNRYCIGIEIEEKYCEIAAKRCSQTVMNLGDCK